MAKHPRRTSIEADGTFTLDGEALFTASDVNGATPDTLVRIDLLFRKWQRAWYLEIDGLEPEPLPEPVRERTLKEIADEVFRPMKPPVPAKAPNKRRKRRQSTAKMNGNAHPAPSE